ncbi:MAG: electron transfer flavoprotein subunit beta/FixA family protein [Bacteroidales bacterium]|nr:electron transfer flavoprotein subunit beta/FixA family protein [Bacteroidales bacterium]MDT8374498.1 electron transfer flavoprotein subunit beta/FixA family protein [Bacteroidales bacterium]
MKGIKIVVLAKQVPDTRNVGPDAMKADGTVNRSVLPAIFNPEDLNALEQALRIREQYEGSTVTVLTMGPGRAAEIIREGLYRGADDGVLLTDRAFAGSDTLATSYALTLAIRRLEPDLVLGGRQAIDGDTAQVGPQIAEKLGWPQVTYAEEMHFENDRLVIRRRLERGVETVSAPLPLVVTVNGTAPTCRYRNARLVMKYKYARTDTELQAENADYIAGSRPLVRIIEWGTEAVGADTEQLGLSGSPTKVKEIDNVILQSKEAKQLTASDRDIEALVRELLESHTIG